MYSREVRDSQYQEINEIYLVNKLNVKKKKNKKQNHTNKCILIKNKGIG